MVMQTIAVGFENVNTLTSQLRAAGAAIRVVKINDIFNVTITKQPSLATVEEILTCSEPVELNDSTSESIHGFPIEKIAVPLEQLEDSPIVAEGIFSTPVEIVNLPEIANISLGKSKNLSTKKGRKKSNEAEPKQEVKESSAFTDDDSIPF